MSDSKNSLSLFSDSDEETPDTLSAREVAAILGLHIRTVQKKAHRGELRYAPDGQIYRDSVLAYQQTHEQLPKQQVVRRQAKETRQREEQMAPIGALRDMMSDVVRQLMIQQRDLLKQVMAEQRATTRDMTREMMALLREQVSEVKTEARQALEAVEAEKQDLLAALKQRPSRKTTAVVPKPGSTLERIYRHLVEVARPQRPDQVERALDLPGPIPRTRRALDKLVERRLVSRIRPGVYQALAPTRGLPSDTGPQASTIERVYQTIRDAEEPLAAGEIQRRLQMPRGISSEITKLLERGRIERVEREGSLPSGYIVKKKE